MSVFFILKIICITLYILYCMFKVQCIEFVTLYSQWPDGCSSLMFSVWSVISTVGYSCSAFAVASRLLARPAVWYHPKVSDAFGCRARVACPAVALCLGFLLHAQISSYLHWALAFPGSCLIHWVFAFVSVWTGTLFRVPVSLCSEWFSSVPRANKYFS